MRTIACVAPSYHRERIVSDFIYLYFGFRLLACAVPAMCYRTGLIVFTTTSVLY